MSRLQAAVFQVLEGFTLSDDVRKILEAAYYADDTFAQGRAAGLEEAAKICEKLGDDYDMKESHKWPELKSDAYAGCQDCESAIRALIISPTSSNAGKDDALDAQDEQDRETGRKWREDSSLETWFPFTAEELASAKKVFAAACADLGYISEELGLDPDDGGAEPILDVIRELKTDAARYRWLRDMNDWYAEPRIDEEDGTKWELVFYTTARIEDPTDDDTLDTAIDAALSSLEVIGKGEKG